MTTSTRSARKKNKGRTQVKKPKWTLITFAKIERARKALGFTKASMAEALEVTNSTYHNWRRGTTVPHANQQAILKTRIDALRLPPVGGATSPSQAPGTVGMGTRDTIGGAQCTTTEEQGEIPLSLISVSDVPGIAPITVAYIESQTKQPSAGSVLSFVRELRAVLTG